MKTLSDKELVEFLQTRLMKDYIGEWDPLNNLGHAWCMHDALRKDLEFPLYLDLCDEGMYYRCTVHQEYDFMVISSAIDYNNPSRAICKAVYEALVVTDNKSLNKPKFWQMRKKPETPKVGVGVILRKDGKVLLGLRRGAHGEGQWSLPGGHMEIGEDFPEVCAREVEEETGVKIKGVKKLGFTNDIFEDDGLHYVTLFFDALWDTSQEVMNKEPDKCVEWKWFDQNELPDNIWTPLLNFFAGC